MGSSEFLEDVLDSQDVPVQRDRRVVHEAVDREEPDHVVRTLRAANLLEADDPVSLAVPRDHLVHLLSDVHFYFLYMRGFRPIRFRSVVKPADFLSIQLCFQVHRTRPPDSL
jgi:hypothetical protein